MVFRVLELFFPLNIVSEDLVGGICLACICVNFLDDFFLPVTSLYLTHDTRRYLPLSECILYLHSHISFFLWSYLFSNTFGKRALEVRR